MKIRVISPPPDFSPQVGQALVGAEFDLGTPMDPDGGGNVLFVEMGIARGYEIYEVAEIVSRLEEKDPVLAKQFGSTLSGIQLMSSYEFPKECCELLV